MEYTILGFWKLALGGEVPEFYAEKFKAQFPESDLDFHSPSSFEMMVYGLQQQLEKTDPRPEPDPRLKPYHLLNDVQLEAEDGIEHSTLDRILIDEPAACGPVFRAALREWAREPHGL